MSGLFFFEAKDFLLKDNHLCNTYTRPELTMILFYSPDCPHCMPIIPLFKQLSHTLEGVKYGLVNVKEHYRVSFMSRQTSTPITYVPTTILYYAGQPIQKFNGPYSIKALTQFILEASKGFRNQFAASPNNITEQKVEKNIPEFTVGVPYCDEDSGICYLDFDKAYDNRVDPTSH